jgi:thiol-disulfide isomerase/thioredoxin
MTIGKTVYSSVFRQFLTWSIGMKQMFMRFSAISTFASLLLIFPGCGPQSQETAKSASSTATEKSNTASLQPAISNASDSPTTADPKIESAISLKPVDFEGYQSELKKLSGKYILVDVWSTACLPCMKEYPNLVTLSTRWPDRLACVSMNVDYTGIKSKPLDTYIPKATSFLEKQKSTSVVNLISSTPDSEIYGKLEIDSIPSILLYDTEGKLLKQFAEVNAAGEAMTYEKDIIPELESMLK